MSALKGRHYAVHSGPLSRGLLLVDLALALALAFTGDAALRLAVCAAAVPCSMATCAVLRWRICGDLRRSLAWAFVPAAAGIAACLAIK